MATNPVVFTEFESSPDFIPFTKQLSEFSWKNQLVGLTESGLLYVDEKVAASGYYNFFPKLLPWKEISEVRIKKTISIKGILFGIILVLFAICVVYAGWINRTHVGPGIFTIPVIGFLGGFVLIFGAIRNTARVEANTGTYQWMSGPLNYQKSIPLCLSIAAHCAKHQVNCESHLEEFEATA